MKRIKDLFDAQASSPSETALLYNGSVGFRIPDYQRSYEWSERNIVRLVSDCLSGFYRLGDSPNADAFTFLGTLILVREKHKEQDFGGTSVAVVDGQQRLTTLTLLACSLYTSLNTSLDKLESFDLKHIDKKWIAIEIRDRQADLLECAVGSQRIRGNMTYPYPRITRTEDQRGRSSETSAYRSPLGKFLNCFSEHINTDTTEFNPPPLGSSADSQKLEKNYQIVRDLVEKLNDLTWYDEIECGQVSMAKIDRSGYRSLLERLPDAFENTDDQSRAILRLKDCTAAHDLLRTLLFAAYFCQCIVLTRVTTDDESAAFDIFDALNTTGEPLTALETLKPRVIEFEKSHGQFMASESYEAFSRLTEHVNELYKDAAKKQKETKELIVTFALYIEGYKLPENLADQRTFLRTRYDRSVAQSSQQARRFVSLLADISEFKRYYWTIDGIKQLARYHNDGNLNQVQLLISFIREMRTKLALPILARYWTPDLRNEGDSDFLKALKCVTAFLILRRAASGGTAGLDSDLRSMMASKNGPDGRFELSAGIESENPKLSIIDLKHAFRDLLSKSKFKISRKDQWVEQVIGNPLYLQARVIVRFMHLIAAHQSIPSSKQPGCWRKEGVKGSSHSNNFLTYETWHNDLYKTVEHIAPENEPNGGWDQRIYKNMIVRHSLGNLTLLPKQANAAIGNDAWKRKKIFYRALTEETDTKLQLRIEEAHKEGITFTNYTMNLLKSEERLSLLYPLRDIEEWNLDVINERGRNTAELTWEYLWPWLE